MGKLGKSKKKGIFFVAPMIIFVGFGMGYPLVYSIWMSFHSWRMSLVESPVFVGFQNYIDLLSDERTINAIIFTFKYFGIAIIFEMLIGLGLAVVLNQIKKARGIIRTLFIMPMVATPIAMGYVWRIMYDSTLGIFNGILRFLGLSNVAWLEAGTVFKSLMIMEVWCGVPLIMLITLAGLSGMSTDYYEAARIDGANSVQIFFRVTLPQLMPTLTMAFLLRGVEVLKVYDILLATTNGGPNQSTENLNLLVYTYAFDYLQMGQACALMLIFFVVVLAFSIVCLIVKNKLEARFS